LVVYCVIKYVVVVGGGVSRVGLLQMMTLVSIWLAEEMTHIILMTVAFMYHQSPKAVWQMES
jgi:hypothetical protein